MLLSVRNRMARGKSSPAPLRSSTSTSSTSSNLLIDGTSPITKEKGRHRGGGYENVVNRNGSGDGGGGGDGVRSRGEGGIDTKSASTASLEERMAAASVGLAGS